jgi:hypothetical protein
LVRKFRNFTQHLRLHPLASKKVSHDFKQLVLHVPHKDEHLLVTHNDVSDMYASVRKCIITFLESLETFLTTYCTKRRSSNKISDFLSKVTNFLHLFLIKSTNIYNNRQTWSENSETSPNILDCIH